MTWEAIIVAGCFLAMLLGFACIKVVPQNEEWTLEHFGKFSKVLKSGLHIITPVVDQIGRKVSIREVGLDVPPQEVVSKDNAIVTIDAVAFYRVFNSEKAAYKVANLRWSMAQLIMTNLRGLVGQMILDKLLSNREVINQELLKIVDEATDPWGVKVLRVEIKDITPPPDLQDAMSSEMKAERKKHALIL